MKDPRFHLPEVLFTTLGAALVTGLAFRVGWHAVTLAALALWLVYIGAVSLTTPGSRVRLLTNYLATWSCYVGSSVLVEQLRIPLQHARLLQWDMTLFGNTPAVALQKVFQPGMNDALSLGYLSYQVWLLWALADAFFRSPQWRFEMGRWVFGAFAIGFAGYFLFPAAPPAQAFPELFTSPVQGGWITQANNLVNEIFAARYDAFPSLHFLVTLALATWDRRHFRLRFWIMLPPALLMIIATLALRLHYGVDLLASLVLFAILSFLLRSAPASRHA